MKRLCRSKKRQISVRLGSEIERLAILYAEANGITVSESVRELLHFFKFLVHMVNGLDELRKLVEMNGVEVYENSIGTGGVKINVALTDNDIEFLDTVSRITGMDRSSSLRFSILSLYYVLNYLLAFCSSLSERGQQS